MLIANSAMKTEVKHEMRGGQGDAVLLHVTAPEQLNGKGRLFARITLEPGCSIGYHEHHGESELFYIISGRGRFSDDGGLLDITAGDCAICEDGHGHSIENTGDQPLIIMALILYTKGH